MTFDQKSNSYLNLSTTVGEPHSSEHHQNHPSFYWTPPSLPSSPARERRLPAIPVDRRCGPPMAAETPILDPLSSRQRPHDNGSSIQHNDVGNHHRNQVTGSNHSLLSSSDGASVTYDYHNAQLDMFLDEYKTLRKELTKMKRTCNTLRLSNASLASSAITLDAVNHSVNKPEPPAPSSSRTTPKSILKNKNQATYVYRTNGERRNSYHYLQLEPSPDNVYLS